MPMIEMHGEMIDETEVQECVECILDDIMDALSEETLDLMLGVELNEPERAVVTVIPGDRMVASFYPRGARHLADELDGMACGDPECRCSAALTDFTRKLRHAADRAEWLSTLLDVRGRA